MQKIKNYIKKVLNAIKAEQVKNPKNIFEL